MLNSLTIAMVTGHAVAGMVLEPGAAVLSEDQ